MKLKIKKKAMSRKVQTNFKDQLFAGGAWSRTIENQVAMTPR